MGHRLLFATILAGCVLLLNAAALAQADVEITLDTFGAGNAYRPGDYVGIRLDVTALPDSPLEEVTNAWVQWEVPNADGDIAEYGREVALNTGRPSRVWLYAPISPETSDQTVWSIRAFTYDDGRRGRELGGGRISPPSTNRVRITESMIGVVGSAQMGLGQYRLIPAPRGGMVYSAHENTRLVFGMRPEDLPDRWEGLRAYEAIAWAGALPADLPLPQAEALREYIRRGGHLVISLPEDTNPWGLGEIARTELYDLLPGETPRKDEDVPVSELLPIMSKARGLGATVPDFPVSIRVFKDLAGDFDAVDNQYEPFIALPDGRVVAIQRLFGHGRITILGIDLDNRRLASLQLSNGALAGLPQADMFWNSILGRRSDTPLPGEITALDEQELLVNRSPTEILIGRGGLFLQMINMTGKAAGGLGLALLLFAAYWVIAGPGGFALLRYYKRSRHAWVAFAAAAVVFTFAAWGGVILLRSQRTAVQHVTYLTHIARPNDGGWGQSDPQYQRAISWLSVYLPGYGNTPVQIDAAGDGQPRGVQRDLLASWEPPGETVQKFPNVDRYTVDVGSAPDDFALPARATATHLHADWLGALDPEWGGTLRGEYIRVERDAGGNEQLTGTIRSELPAALTDVQVFWIRNKRLPDRRYAMSGGVEARWVPEARSGQMLNLGKAISVGRLEPGGTLDLSFGDSQEYSLERTIDDRFVEPFAGRSAPNVLRQNDYLNFMRMLGFYHQLTPPSYLKANPDAQDPESMLAVRMVGRELDLSPWFARPCIIVTGFLENVPIPIPLRVDGETPKSDEGSRVVVRWIYPLPVDESIAFRVQQDADRSTQ